MLSDQSTQEAPGRQTKTRIMKRSRILSRYQYSDFSQYFVEAPLAAVTASAGYIGILTILYAEPLQPCQVGCGPLVDIFRSLQRRLIGSDLGVLER